MNIINKRAISILEYLLLFIIVISAYLLMQNYIQRGLYGNWAKTGQSFAYGRQYDPQKSVECGFDDISNLWYDRNCFEYFKNINGCYNVTPTYCADKSKCGIAIPGTCADGTTCGVQSCEENIINKDCSTVNICRSSVLFTEVFSNQDNSTKDNSANGK